jgi:preprotein translocase SecE subunit
MAAKKPRVRKAETIRQRNERVIARTEAKANKQPQRRLRRIIAIAFKPIGKFLYRISWPLRLRPVRFIGRVLGRIFWPRYFRNAYKELRQVHWPSRRETWKLTFAVLIFAITFGGLAAGTDFVLDKVIRRIVFRS